jgi:hypothetical protein
MANILDTLKSHIETGVADPHILSEIVQEFDELRIRTNELEELLIMIVRTGWPWDEEGEPNAIYHASKDGFATAMVEARKLLGLQRSTITRTEPKT